MYVSRVATTSVILLIMVYVVMTEEIRIGWFLGHLDYRIEGTESGPPNLQTSRNRRAVPYNYSKQIVTYGPIDVNTGSFLLEEKRPEIYNPDIHDFDRSTGLESRATESASHDMFVSTILVVMIVGISCVAVLLACSLWHGGRSSEADKRLLC